MIVAEPYQRDGRTLLRNLRHATEVPPGYVDTGLSAMPSGFEKLVWNGSQVVPIVLTDEEKIDRLDVRPRHIWALAIWALPVADTLPAERQRARALLLQIRDAGRDAVAASVQAART